MKKLLVLLAAIPVVAFTSSAWAYGAGATGPLFVEAAVSTECVVESGGLFFGEYAPITGGDRMSESSFIVRCTKGTAVHIGLGEGNNFDGVRRMRSGVEDFLYYSLYQDGGLNSEWKDTDNVDRVAIPYTSGIYGDWKTVYGRVPGFQNQPAGWYMDVVAINVWID